MLPLALTLARGGAAAVLAIPHTWSGGPVDVRSPYPGVHIIASVRHALLAHGVRCAHDVPPVGAREVAIDRRGVLANPDLRHHGLAERSDRGQFPLDALLPPHVHARSHRARGILRSRRRAGCLTLQLGRGSGGVVLPVVLAIIAVVVGVIAVVIVLLYGSGARRHAWRLVDGSPEERGEGGLWRNPQDRRGFDGQRLRVEACT
mmetsp:Transcript_15426/g.48567  ORF Transcript_15426/g.48567 Transcript_15426/m.48567 type:complete len:204 (-) Transcript_15426:422-1033(-)